VKKFENVYSFRNTYNPSTDPVCLIYANYTGCQCDKESGLKQLSWCTSAFTAWLRHTWYHTANQHHLALVGSICMRSATSGQLNFPRMKTDYGKRSFAVNGPVVWNSLPTELRSPDISLDVFKAKLKTFLFNC